MSRHSDYPPYDLVQVSEGTYRIDVALAGYKREEVEIVAQQNLLTVKGERAQENEQGEILHRGISMRSFERRFQLADFVEVGKRGVKTAGQAAWAIGAVSEDFQFHGMSSSQREAGQPPAIFSMASAM